MKVQVELELRLEGNRNPGNAGYSLLVYTTKDRGPFLVTPISSEPAGPILMIFGLKEPP